MCIRFHRALGFIARDLSSERDSFTARVKRLLGKQMTDFRAVSIVGGTGCCRASQALKGKRLLMTQGVFIPLAACTMSDRCKCRYGKHSDRRADDDRRILGSTQRSALYAINERRQVGGRRPADR